MLTNTHVHSRAHMRARTYTLTHHMHTQILKLLIHTTANKLGVIMIVKYF